MSIIFAGDWMSIPTGIPNCPRGLEYLMRDIKIHYYYIRLLPQSPFTCQQLL